MLARFKKRQSSAILNIISLEAKSIQSISPKNERPCQLLEKKKTSNSKEQRALHRALSKERSQEERQTKKWKKQWHKAIIATDGGKLYSATLTFGLSAALFPVSWRFSRSSIWNSLDNSRGLKLGRRRSTLAFRLVNAARDERCVCERLALQVVVWPTVWWAEAEVVPPMAATESVRLSALSRVE